MPANPTATAQALAASGRVTDAVAALRSAGHSGDAIAMMELAVWHLRGDLIPRDLIAARVALRQAVRIGHVDAALMEVALTANGSGGDPDWAGAVRLLAAAANADPVAAAQRDCIVAMALTPDGYPAATPVGEALSEHCGVTRYRKFLTAAECQQVANAAHDLLAPAVVIDPQSGVQRAHPVRTSDSAVIGPVRENLVVQAITRRIAAITRTDVAQGEPLALLRYRPGQQYRPHLDTIAGAANQRIRTVLIYLNAGFRAETRIFPSCR